ncbi:MAG: metalloregulator ArsR/SmtB family transcription factor [Actinomycetota bacterium]
MDHDRHAVTHRAVVGGAELLKVLGSPVRLGVILALDEHGEHCVHELTDRLGVNQPLMSQHLRVLRAANLIVGRRAGKEVRYTIADHHVTHIVRDAITHAEEATT